VVLGVLPSRKLAEYGVPHATSLFFATHSRILAFCATVDRIAPMTIKHPTASVFLFAPTLSGWQLGLIQHPRFRRWMLPGGHVEPEENPAETARREVKEETGLQAELLVCPRLATPGRIDQQVVPPPLWILEEDVPPERRQPSDHIHIDFLYAATTCIGTPRVTGELRLGWFSPDELDGLGLFEDTLLLAHELSVQLPALIGG
jgi:8-oxo-dGTP pyrophosphatase MutT (NUDIX family)